MAVAVERTIALSNNERLSTPSLRPVSTMEFLPVEGAVVIPIGGSEELLDQSQILVLVQRPILIGICPPTAKLLLSRPFSTD
jgi:hypothetical protein